MSFPSLPTPGNLILVECEAWNGNDNGDWSVGDCTDNQGSGNYPLAVKSPKNGAARSAIFYLGKVVGSSGTFTITVNPAPHGGSYIVASASEWSGEHTVDQTASNSGSSTTPSTGTTGTTTAATEIVAACMSITAGQASITVDSVSPAWTEEFEELSFAYEPGEADSRVVTSTGTQSCGWTCASSAAWTACIATFKAVASPSVETVAVVDALRVVAGLQRTRFESVAVAEQLAGALYGLLGRSRSDALIITEAVLRSLPTARRLTVADAVAITESVRAKLGLAQRVADAVTVADVLTRLLPFLKADAITVTDVVTAVTRTVRHVETIRVFDYVFGVARPLLLQRTVFETISVTERAARAQGITTRLKVIAGENLKVTELRQVTGGPLVWDGSGSAPPVISSPNDYWVVGV